MICEQGRVIAVDDASKVAYVQVIQQSSCQSCSAKKGCGTQLMNSVFKGKRHTLELSYSHLNEEDAFIYPTVLTLFLF